MSGKLFVYTGTASPVSAMHCIGVYQTTHASGALIMKCVTAETVKSRPVPRDPATSTRTVCVRMDYTVLD